MKYLLILTLLASCASPVRRTHKKTTIQKLAECTERYFSVHGVNPTEAYEICEKIYRRRK